MGGHIALQFVMESASMAALGGVLGVSGGAAVSVAYANCQGWLTDVPVEGAGSGHPAGADHRRRGRRVSRRTSRSS